MVTELGKDLKVPGEESCGGRDVNAEDDVDRNGEKRSRLCALAWCCRRPMILDELTDKEDTHSSAYIVCTCIEFLASISAFS